MREAENLPPSTARNKNAWRCNSCVCVSFCLGGCIQTGTALRCTGCHTVGLHIVVKEIEYFKLRRKCGKSEQAVA